LTHPALPDRAFAAFLFDMDGTLLSSIACAERAWACRAGRHGIGDCTAVAPRVDAGATLRLVAVAG
jgi:sugar-phosphatase